MTALRPAAEAAATPPSHPVVRVRRLSKRYHEVIALNRVDLDIGRGEIFALLGPNGAGKTTAVEILEGHRHRDAGEVSVLGTDPARAGRSWRARIGIVPQRASNLDSGALKRLAGSPLRPAAYFTGKAISALVAAAETAVLLAVGVAFLGVRLPAAPGGAVVTGGQPPGRPVRVLVADDHPVVRAGLVAMLSAEPGLEVVGEAASGEEAVLLAARHRPAVVLTDLRMPGSGGPQSAGSPPNCPAYLGRILCLTDC